MQAIFNVSVNWLPAAQQNSKPEQRNYPNIFQRLWNEVRALEVNEIKITVGNAFNPDHLWMGGKHESKNEGKTFF